MNPTPAECEARLCPLSQEAQARVNSSLVQVQGHDAGGYFPGAWVDIATVRYGAALTGTPTLEAIGFTVPQVRGKKVVQGLIRLSAEVKAKSVVQLESSHPDVLPVPAGGIMVKRDRATALFALRAKRVTVPTEVTVTATFGGVTKEAVITVRP